MALYDIGRTDANGRPVLLNRDALSFAEWLGGRRATRELETAWKRGERAPSDPHCPHGRRPNQRCLSCEATNGG